MSTTATLQYGVPPSDGSRAFYKIDPNLPLNKIEKSHTYEEKTAVIENVRGKEETFTLDGNGFQFSKHKSTLAAKEFADESAIVSKYYAEGVELIKKLTGASRVVVFDHTIRRRKANGEQTTPDDREPVAHVHVDQTSQASIARVHRHLPAEEAPKLLEKRFQIINLWRPIENPALDWPLTVCDFSSVDEKKDLFPVALIYPDREGETYGVRHNPAHKWKYLHGMTPEEFVLIKCFDSVQDGSVAVFTPHTGFKDPNTPEGAPPRQSIEIRTLVFYD